MRTYHLYLKAVAAALAGILAFALAEAHAITITGANVVTTPGSAFVVAFDFDFGVDTAISSLQLDLAFDTTRVTFAGLSSATYQGTSYTPAAVTGALASAGTYSESTDATGLHATWYALDSNTSHPLPALHLSGQAELVYSFSLLAGTTPGTTTDVGITLDYSDAALNPVNPVARTVTVTAVPEPGTWMALVTGLGLLGTLLRRKAFLERRHSERTLP